MCVFSMMSQYELRDKYHSLILLLYYYLLFKCATFIFDNHAFYRQLYVYIHTRGESTYVRFARSLTPQLMITGKITL